jgi:hypothetical protein
MAGRVPRSSLVAESESDFDSVEALASATAWAIFSRARDEGVAQLVLLGLEARVVAL